MNLTYFIVKCGMCSGGEETQKLTVLTSCPFKARWTLTDLLFSLYTLTSVETCIGCTDSCRQNIEVL